MRKVEKRPDRRLSIHSPAVISEMDWNAQIAIQITKKRVVVRLRKPCSSQNHSPYWTACSTVRTETLQVQGGDQPPLPTNGNSFVACSMPKVLHAPANWKNIVRSFTSVQMFHTHTHIQVFCPRFVIDHILLSVCARAHQTTDFCWLFMSNSVTTISAGFLVDIPWYTYSWMGSYTKQNWGCPSRLPQSLMQP